MAETYCGKSCDNCAEKSQLNCPGCRVGPGKAHYGDCSISKCCVSKRFRVCEQCNAGATCFTRQTRQNAAVARLRKQMHEAARQQRLFIQSRLLGKWLWVLFWLVIVSNIGSLVFGEDVVNMIPELQIPASIFNVVIGVSYALILLKLTPVSNHYRVSGIAMFVCIAFQLLTVFLGDSGWGIAIGLIAMVPSFIMEFQEYLGHSNAAEDLDVDMARKWITLWYWNFGCMCAIALGMVLTLLQLLFGAFMVLVSSIALIVIAIIKIKYLYSTAKAFREYSKSCSEIV